MLMANRAHVCIVSTNHISIPRAPKERGKVVTTDASHSVCEHMIIAWYPRAWENFILDLRLMLENSNELMAPKLASAKPLLRALLRTLYPSAFTQCLLCDLWAECVCFRTILKHV